MVDWLDKWQPDHFAKPSSRPPKAQKKKFDAVEILQGLRLFTDLDRQEFYISEMLGQLIKNGFLPKWDLSRGWGALDEPERDKLITWARAKMALMEKQKLRADQGFVPTQHAIQHLAAKKDVEDQNAYFVQMGRKLDLENARWLKPAD